ncbi:MAG: DUF4392 domain-containing protein [Firmicutes bacterium]|nr:DUF4392 domain-containing protein [Bacillota bacterium]
MPKVIGENIDRLCNIEYRPSEGAERGSIIRYYNAAREAQGDPLTYHAAKALIDNVKPGDTVLFVTGARFPHMLPYGETDGPLGAAALAKAVERGLGAKTVVTVEASNDVATRECMLGVGCNLRTLEDFDGTKKGSYLDFYPLGEEEGPKHAKWLVERFKPKAIVFCEKHGPNEVGECHSVHGARIPKEEFANTWHLLDEAKKHGIVTIGTGDGGNEIGNGVIYEAAREIAPYGKKCQCGCGGGVATVCKTDVFVAAAISNWGLYGVSAMLAYMLGDVDIMHTVDEERRMLEGAVRGGSVDGMSMTPICGVDGVSMAGGQAQVTLLREMVKNGLSKCDRTE